MERSGSERVFGDYDFLSLIDKIPHEKMRELIGLYRVARNVLEQVRDGELSDEAFHFLAKLKNDLDAKSDIEAPHFFLKKLRKDLIAVLSGTADNGVGEEFPNGDKRLSLVITIDTISINCLDEEGRTLASFRTQLDMWLKPEKKDEEDLNPLPFLYAYNQYTEILDRFVRQNLGRESMNKAIKESLLEKCSITIFDKGGMYILAEHESEEEMYCVWKLPKEGYYAIETDASFEEKRKAGSSAFLIRDCKGRVVYACRSVYKEYKSSIEYEAAGILNGVKQAVKMEFKRVEVRSDCQSLIKAIEDPFSKVPEIVKSIVESIHTERKNFDSIEFHFVHRGINRAADWLSKFRMKEVGNEEEWVLPPEGVSGGAKELPKLMIYHCGLDAKGNPQKKQKKAKLRSI